MDSLCIFSQALFYLYARGGVIMSRLPSSLRYALCLVPLALTACGEGWVPVYTDDVFPYGNHRTAGRGVTYVRSSLLPAKTLNVEEISAPEPEAVVAEPPKPVVEPEIVPEPVPVEPAKMDRVFQDAQAK